MIFAAAAAGRAAAAAAGISYLFHDDDDDAPSNPTADVKQKSTVTISSTLVDQHGVVKAVIYPRIPPNPQSWSIHSRRLRPDQGTVSSIERYRCNRCLIPMESHSQTPASRVQRKLAVLFFWSIPLKARLFRACTRPAVRLENLNRFERHPIRISIGVQNESGDHDDCPRLRYYLPSEVALSHVDDKPRSLMDNDDTFDSLSSHPMINDRITPIGILKKKPKPDRCCPSEFQSKRIRSENHSDSTVSWNDQTMMRDLILTNVHRCVENLSKILGETCSNPSEELLTMTDSSSTNNNNQQTSSRMRRAFYEGIPSRSVQTLRREQDVGKSMEKLPDGIILHRGPSFGLALGEPLIRRDDLDECGGDGGHSIDVLDRLLSRATCGLMREHQIQTVEDLVRLFLVKGQNRFTELMVHFFQVDRWMVEQLSSILMNWANRLN